MTTSKVSELKQIYKGFIITAVKNGDNYHGIIQKHDTQILIKKSSKKFVTDMEAREAAIEFINKQLMPDNCYKEVNND